MARMTVSLPDSILSKVDEQADGLGIPRSQYVSEALDFYATERTKLEIDIDKLNNLIIAKDKELESKTREVLQLQEKVHTLENRLVEMAETEAEVDKLRETIEEKESELDRNKPQLEQTSQLWGETRSLRSENSQLKRELEEAKSTTLKLKDELLKKQVDADQARAEVEISRVKLDSYLNALKVKDDDIAFLRGHVSQLSEKITPALPPSQEEAKRKRWWKFWRRG